MSRLQRLKSYILSFRTTRWSVRDYPVICRRQLQGPSRVRGELAYPKAWIALIDGWAGPVATGDTREEALAALQSALDEWAASEGPLPRPGTNVPIQFAPIEFMSRNEDLAREFFPPILDYEYDDCLITDRSSVWDFPVEMTAADLSRKVLLIFGTDISDVAEEGNISAILDRIAAHRGGVATD